MNFNSLQLNLNAKLVDLSTPQVMGIINLSPDSFYKESRVWSDKSIISKVEKMLEDGAFIIDVGGYSSRPGAEIISIDEEIKRLSKGLEIILKKFPDVLISVDTFRSGVARHVVTNYKVPMINDIGGGTLDDMMFETIANLKVAYILMHTKGSPQSMQKNTSYSDILAEILHYFDKRLSQLRIFGVKDILIDPGFGFAKTIEQNFLLLRNLSLFKELNVPILAGISRKSMIYQLLGITANEALNATTAAHIYALEGGATILRVHDVKEAREAITIFNEIHKH